MAAKTKNKLTRFEWVKKNIVIVPVVAAILAGTFTSIRYVLNLTDTIEANKQTLINIQRDIEVLKDSVDITPNCIHILINSANAGGVG